MLLVRFIMKVFGAKFTALLVLLTRPRWIILPLKLSYKWKCDKIAKSLANISLLDANHEIFYWYSKYFINKFYLKKQQKVYIMA